MVCGLGRLNKELLINSSGIASRLAGGGSPLEIADLDVISDLASIEAFIDIYPKDVSLKEAYSCILKRASEVLGQERLFRCIEEQKCFGGSWANVKSMQLDIREVVQAYLKRAISKIPLNGY